MIFCFFQTGATRIFHGFRWDQGTKPVSPVYPTRNGIFFLRRFLVLFVSDQCFQIWIQLPKIWAPTTCTCVCYFGLQWPPVKFVDPPVNHLLTRNPRKNPLRSNLNQRLCSEFLALKLLLPACFGASQCQGERELRATIDYSWTGDQRSRKLILFWKNLICHWCCCKTGVGLFRGWRRYRESKGRWNHFGFQLHQ